MTLFINWNPDVVALDLGFFAIRWYSICWCIGLLAVYWLMHRLYRQQKISEEQFEPMFMYCFLGILVGARLGHCLFYEPGYFLSHPIEMVLPIRHLPDGSWKFTGYEGLASHGGTLGLMLALWLYARNMKLNIMRVLDNVGIVTPICACAIRLGNLMNSEIIGRPTDVPWAFIFERVDMVPRHPGQLYEALCYACFFFIGWWIYRKSMQPSADNRFPQVGSGFYFGLCLFLIFTSRIFIEYTKKNQEAFENGMLFNMGQLLSVPFVLLGLYCMLGGKWCKKLAEKKRNTTHTMRKFLIIALLFAANIMGISAQEGTWSGELEAQGMKLPLFFNFNANGTTFDSPSQNLIGIKAEKSITPEGKIRINIPQFTATFEGVMVMNVISGNFIQNGFSWPLTLTKVNRPQTPQGPFPYNTEEVTFQNGEFTFHGTLSMPKDCTAKTPVVLLVTGSEQQDRDENIFEHRPFAVIADALARNGIASLRYDDRGYGDSSIPFYNFNTHDFKDDAAAGLSFLRKRFQKVGIVGHSEGGTIALMLAAEGKADFIVSLAGMAVSGKETLLWQNRLLFEASGIPQETVEQILVVVGNIFDKVAQGEQESIDYSLAPEALRPVLQQGIKQLSTPYRKHLITVDVRPQLPQIKCPVLALNGTKDTQVNCQTNLEAIDKGITAPHQVVAMEGLNHLFQHCTTGSFVEYQQIEETFDPETIQKIIKWIKAKKKKKLRIVKL